MINNKTLNNFEVNPIGIGTWKIGGAFYDGTRIDYADYDHDEESIEAIKYSIEKGQNHIDTAQIYGSGHSEEIVGKAIKRYDRTNLFIASKIWQSHLKRSAVPFAVEAMLRRLDTPYLDMLYVHNAWDIEPMESYISGMCDALDRGLTRSIAVSNFTLEKLEQATNISKHPIIANQVHYSVLTRQNVDNGMQEYCKKNNIMIVAYKPVERGVLNDEKGVLSNLAQKYNATPSQLSIAWLISQDNTITIPKAVQKKHIDENLGALTLEITEEDRNVLNNL